MHGIIAPTESHERHDRRSIINLIRTTIWRRRMFLLIVIAPTLIVAGYLYLIASDQYESEAHFVVRTANSSQVAPAAGLGQALSFVTGGNSAQTEAMGVADYLTSHDVVESLRRHDRLVERFNRSDIDLLSRLRSINPTPERLLKYYRSQVKVRHDTETGITTLTVHSFEPQDSYDIACRLLQLGEQRVNEMNVRSYSDAVATSRRQLSEAEEQLEQLQLKMTTFRQKRHDIDPEASGKSQIGLVSTLTGQLATARAQLNAMGGMISHSSPQYRALAGRAQALEGQVAAQSDRLAGGSHTIANDLSSYQALELRQQFLAKRYEAAAASFEKAREDARRQQLYVVRVVDANLPVKALFPERLRILSTILITLLLTYSIGWLIAAGVKEHAA